MSGSKLSDAAPQRSDSLRPVIGDHPLGLTVHALPEPRAVVDHDQRRTRIGRWKMLLVLLVCAAPVIASYFTYYVVRPEARRVYGELL